MSETTITPPAPSGRQWLLRKENHEATVVEIGGGLRECRLDGEPVLDGFAVDVMASGARGTTLAPWPNRLRDGHYRFSGKDQQLALSEPAKQNAMHGLVRWRPWALVEQGTDHVSVDVTLLPQPGYPYSLHLRNDYLLDADGLTVTTTATNLGGEPLPYGLGFHPYLTAGTATVDDLVLVVPAQQHILVDERGLPAGREAVDGTEHDFRNGRRIGAQVIDATYADLVRDESGRAAVVAAGADGARSVALWCLPPFAYLQVFTGDTLPVEQRRRGLGVEPMTCPPDAFNSGEGLLSIAPGDQVRTTWGLSATLR